MFRSFKEYHNIRTDRRDMDKIARTLYKTESITKNAIEPEASRNRDTGKRLFLSLKAEIS